MAFWISETCKVNGINIHYLRTGGNKPTVVLLHGLMTSGACWTFVARSLEKDYDVIMPDSRGHGNSSVPQQGYSYNNLAMDVFGFIEVLKLTNLILVGHSMGGMTAAMVASLNSRQIRGLVLVDPPFLDLKRQREVFESDVASQHQIILKRSKENFLAEMLIKHRHRPSELIELMVQARYQTSVNAFDILTPSYPDYRQLIRTFAIPTLLVIGGVGSIITPIEAKKLAMINPCLKIVQIVEAGHGIPYDQPERFADIIKFF